MPIYRFVKAPSLYVRIRVREYAAYQYKYACMRHIVVYVRAAFTYGNNILPHNMSSLP